MGQWLRKVLGRKGSREEGFAFVVVLIFMLIGSIIVAGALGYMGSGAMRGLIYQNRTHELYAADSGVKEAIWNLKAGELVLTEGNSANLTLLDGNVNNKVRNVTVFCQKKTQFGGTYKITSVANTPGSSNRTIEAWVEARPFLFDYAAITTQNITSPSGVGKGIGIDGPVAGDTSGFAGTINGRIDPPWDPTAWPFNTLGAYYYTPEVDNVTLLASINTDTTHEIGPGHTDGNMTFNGSSTGNVTLTGTVYVGGDLSFEKKSNEGWVLNLNNKTIFVKGSITTKPNTPRIVGSGCIIAVGDIGFWPQMETTSSDYVFVLSLEGKINFQPLGDFYGSVCGDVNVNLQPNNHLYWTDPSNHPELNFPDSVGGVEANVHVRTWKIIP